MIIFQISNNDIILFDNVELQKSFDSYDLICWIEHRKCKNSYVNRSRTNIIFQMIILIIFQISNNDIIYIRLTWNYKSHFTATIKII